MEDLSDTIKKIEKEQRNINEQDKEKIPVKSFREKYLGFVQRHRNVAFLKNMIISGTTFMAGGYLGAKAMKLGTDSKSLISAGSLVSQYVVGFGAFLPLHAFDNYDIYKAEGDKFKYKELAKDTAKLFAGLGVLEVAYIIGRPILHYNFMKKGIDPGTASLYSDLICAPAYWALTIPVAKLFGVIKKSKKD
jgi:hypothetical protein